MPENCEHDSDANEAKRDEMMDPTRLSRPFSVGSYGGLKLLTVLA